MGAGKGILLDTSVLIDILDKGSLLDLIEKEELYISVISIYEYIRYKKNKEFFKKKLEESFIVLGLNNETLLESALIFEALKRRGKPVSENDIYIAATAIAHNLELWTRDTDYEKIKMFFPKLELRLLE